MRSCELYVGHKDILRSQPRKEQFESIRCLRFSASLTLQNDSVISSSSGVESLKMLEPCPKPEMLAPCPKQEGVQEVSQHSNF